MDNTRCHLIVSPKRASASPSTGDRALVTLALPSTSPLLPYSSSAAGQAYAVPAVAASTLPDARRSGRADEARDGAAMVGGSSRLEADLACAVVLCAAGSVQERVAGGGVGGKSPTARAYMSRSRPFGLDLGQVATWTLQLPAGGCPTIGMAVGPGGDGVGRLCHGFTGG
jgi:hypothetical protein